MPLASESLIDPNWTSSPSKRIEPSYVPCGYTPDSTFISVDLPAPFSPQIAWISPRWTDIDTSCSALTPGKVLVMACISRMGLAMGLPPSFVVQGAAVGTPRGGRPGPTGTVWVPAGRRSGRYGSGLAAGDLVLGPVARVDQERLDVVLVDDVRLEEEGRDDLDAVVVRLGVVGLGLLTGEEGLRRDDGLLGELAGVLEDRRELDVVVDQLDRRDLRVLAGDDRQAVGDASGRSRRSAAR